MKKLSIIFIVAVFCNFNFCNFNLFAAYNHAITTDPLDFINSGRVNVRYEHLFSKNNSGTAELYFDTGDDHYSGFLIGVSYRWYLREVFPIKTTALEGFAVGPFARMAFYTIKHGAKDTDGSLEIGGEVAYKWVFGGFAVEPIIRLGVPVVRPGYITAGFHAWPGVSIGYAW